MSTAFLRRWQAARITLRASLLPPLASWKLFPSISASSIQHCPRSLWSFPFLGYSGPVPEVPSLLAPRSLRTSLGQLVHDNYDNSDIGDNNLQKTMYQSKSHVYHGSKNILGSCIMNGTSYCVARPSGEETDLSTQDVTGRKWPSKLRPIL
jgi:hypothetical protein